MGFALCYFRAELAPIRSFGPFWTSGAVSLNQKLCLTLGSTDRGQNVSCCQNLSDQDMTSQGVYERGSPIEKQPLLTSCGTQPARRAGTGGAGDLKPFGLRV